MGLSNEERLYGLYYDINAIVGHGKKIKSYLQDFQKKDYEKLIEYIEGLWHGLLGGDSNPSHWVLGSSATKQIAWDTISPWGIAINKHCQNLKDQPIDDDTFDAFDSFLSVSELLRKYNPLCREVYKIYAFTEQMVYHLRRYEDDLVNKLGSLDKLISNIQGECFNLFIHDQAYASAYVLNQILKILYGNLYPYSPEKWGVTTTHLQRHHIHHNFDRLMNPRESNLCLLSEIHKRLYEANESGKLTEMMKLEAMLELTGRKYHYDHIFKDLVESLKKEKFSSKDIKKLEILFKANKKAHEDDEKQSQEDFKSGRLSPLTIYGL